MRLNEPHDDADCRVIGRPGRLAKLHHALVGVHRSCDVERLETGSIRDATDVGRAKPLSDLLPISRFAVVTELVEAIGG